MVLHTRSRSINRRCCREEGDSGCRDDDDKLGMTDVITYINIGDRAVMPMKDEWMIESRY